MKVTLIAMTSITEDSVFHELTDDLWQPDFSAEAADSLAEFAGRACYQSWMRPNKATADNQGYLGNVIDHGHFSVLEHATASFYVTGVSRALTHELVRHRHFSPSQLSQRFVDSLGADYVVPPACREHDVETDLLENAWLTALTYYDELVESLLARGMARKQAREAARAVLPNMTETKIVITANHRAFREFVSKRFSSHADAEIRELAGELLSELRAIAPNTYQDISQEPT